MDYICRINLLLTIPIYTTTLYITSAFILLAIFASINGDNLLSDEWPNFFYFNPIARLAEFAFGILICNLHLKLRSVLSFTTCSILQIISVCAVAISILKVITFQHALQINMFMLFPFGLLILAFSFSGVLSRLLDKSIFVFLGEISFVFYLVHHSIFRLFEDPVGAFISPLNMRIFFALVIALAFSAIFHITFELPLRNALIRRFLKYLQDLLFDRLLLT